MTFEEILKEPSREFQLEEELEELTHKHNHLVSMIREALAANSKLEMTDENCIERIKRILREDTYGFSV